ncbi:LysR family transcriptional regulator [Paralimibaculum aggregatum]|uniref:LysR family transcriptional regulator n=1 Tax=Paralimibaculum aggregatum TaxID=3036245 RepID=A0ABQ6LRN2_9RHOB|nr:LysR family transcriptional regulator [Limibaculum sp. NKW23]GMG83961.1 LysR family transcriptional regulator [Limibaculum sp. NKW23]
MDLRQLETFRCVARLGSFTQAAHQLNTTQSNVSLRIADLERDLGVELLDRSRRQVRVTAKGRDLLRYAAEIALLVDELQMTVGNPRSISGSLRICAAELIALTWLPALIADLAKRYPRLEIDLEVGLSGDVPDRLRNGAIDIAFVPLAEQPEPDIAAEVLSTIRFGYHCAPDFEMRAGPLSPDDFRALSVISLGPGSTISSIEQRWLGQASRQPQHLQRSNSMEISAGLIRSGLGVGLLPIDFYRDESRNGRLQVLQVDPPIPLIPFYALHLAAGAPPIIDTIKAMAREASADPWTR